MKRCFLCFCLPVYWEEAKSNSHYTEGLVFQDGWSPPEQNPGGSCLPNCSSSCSSCTLEGLLENTDCNPHCCFPITAASLAWHVSFWESRWSSFFLFLFLILNCIWQSYAYPNFLSFQNTHEPWTSLDSTLSSVVESTSTEKAVIERSLLEALEQCFQWILWIILL